MSKTQELLLARRQEVQAEMQTAVAPLKAELREIDAALAAIEGRPMKGFGKPRSKQSIPTQAIEILKEIPDGLQTRAIVSRMKSTFDRDIAPRNMSWHLSRLKSDGALELVGELWRIPVHNDEPPDPHGPSGSYNPDGGNGNPPSNESRSAGDNSTLD